MIHALTCLLFPLIGGCNPFIDYTASVHQIVASPGYYAGRPVLVSGRVRNLNQFTGTSLGTPAEIFELCDGSCVQVFKREHTPAYNGQRISVRGIFLVVDRVGKRVFNNDIEAQEIFPRL